MVLNLPGRSSWVDLDVLFRTTLSQWPAAIIESAGGLPAQRLMTACQLLTFAAHVASHQEFMVYEGDAACRFWHEFGPTREFESSVILVAFQPNEIKLTVDRDGSTSYRVAEAAQAAVRRHRWEQEHAVNFWQTSATQISRRRQ